MERFRVEMEDDAPAVYEEAGRRIREGKLVAFPTETVYGLGGNGLDVEAVKSIYEMKRRPADDPVILHVIDFQDAVELWDLALPLRRVIAGLQEAFWPGPLTIVAKANSQVPSEVTAGTGKVAVRCPAHPVARRLIAAARVPIAAPSANLFSRISPTRADHVAKYFVNEDLMLIDCDSDACTIGIESVVISVEEDSIHILRPGAISRDQLQQAAPGIPVHDKIIPIEPSAPKDAVVAAECDFASSSPGQCLVHYSPSIPTCLIILNDAEKGLIDTEAGCEERETLHYDSADLERLLPLPLSRSAVIDLSANRFGFLKSSCLYWKCLCDATHDLFATFHEIEDMKVPERLYICTTMNDCHTNQGVLDRCIRAAAHHVIHWSPANKRAVSQ
ncbi:Sua5/YciO/YrdC/YwlC family protein [Gregarina niphandrodes]|uniref:Threonylcarbamoyl-AMP synthase n=1 Tax=Gregarina niphandrodes TaxID=110365 RepID=A0A023B499_GRENI|nr:Sua5/YciO/YrdC/YwlC family protein [Gregarina niphandrodes]EZG56502.1 Sua5/YciO/YrdC/YwlC family protein [Gregarina niphandrodes]|eukprot:XP_011131241.1 Sua5/YciO/YrdC/YwlC family protein [Gregarina niphandrodes]